LVTYTISKQKFGQGARLCYYNSLEFWLTGKFASEKGSLNIALGLYILAIEEIGKVKLLHDEFAAQRRGEITIDADRAFKNHRLKLRKAMDQFEEWALSLAGLVPLTHDERQRLWFVGWDVDTGEFKREFTPNLTNVELVGERIRLALNIMEKSTMNLMFPTSASSAVQDLSPWTP
jgi:AbiV family abortive infection protein